MEMAGKLASATSVSEDIAVDPNEPLYCICKRVSFGEMICCDNEGAISHWLFSPVALAVANALLFTLSGPQRRLSGLCCF